VRNCARSNDRNGGAVFLIRVVSAVIHAVALLLEQHAIRVLAQKLIAVVVEALHVLVGTRFVVAGFERLVRLVVAVFGAIAHMALIDALSVAALEITLFGARAIRQFSLVTSVAAVS
jgi:hypothetical protein